MAFGIERVSMRSKLLWTIFALSQLLGSLGAFYYSPHGSHALYFAVLLLLPGIILSLTLPSLPGVGFDFGYAMILVVTIPVNFAAWYICALLIRKIRRQAFKGHRDKPD
jgi:hypothetical protein